MAKRIVSGVPGPGVKHCGNCSYSIMSIDFPSGQNSPPILHLIPRVIPWLLMPSGSQIATPMWERWWFSTLFE